MTSMALIACVGISGLHESIGDITVDRAVLHDADDGAASVPRWQFEGTGWSVIASD